MHFSLKTSFSQWNIVVMGMFLFNRFREAGQSMKMDEAQNTATCTSKNRS